MFNIGVGEITLILIAALVLLGPERLPEMARTFGKFMREFRRHSDEVRGVVLREFYKMEKSIEEDPTAPDAAPIAENGAGPAAASPPEGPKPIEVKSGEQTIAILPATGAVARVAKTTRPESVGPEGTAPHPDPLPEGEGTVTQVDTRKETGP